MTGNERRSAVLDTIRGAVCRDRQNAYGDAEDNFRNIADYWNLWLKQRGFTAVLTPLDVAMMSALLKTARASANLTYSDNWVDLAGYAVCGAGIVAAGPGPVPPQQVDALSSCIPDNSVALFEALRGARARVSAYSDDRKSELEAAARAAIGSLSPTSYATALNEAVREAAPPS